MPSPYMRCTCIAHCTNSNYQVNWQGTKEEVPDYFERWCVGNQVKWAHLFNEKDGKLIASFNNVDGLVTVKE